MLRKSEATIYLCVCVIVRVRVWVLACVSVLQVSMTHGYIKGNVQQPQFAFGLDTKVTNVEGSWLKRQPARDFSCFYLVAQNGQVVY
jgi:hypothetical protein